MSAVVSLKYGRRTVKRKVSFMIFVTIAIFLLDYFGVLLPMFEISYSKFSYPLDISMDEVLASLKQGHTPSLKPINELNYSYRIENERKCLQSGKREKVIVLFVIKSALYNQKRRDVIRKSWGWENRFSDINIKRVFVLGNTSDVLLQVKIDDEYIENKDIVQADFIDNYYNNTIKTILGFKWVVQHCPNAQFIMFADDDMYISTKNLLKFIRDPFNSRVGFRKKRELQNYVKKDKISLEYRLNVPNLNSNLLDSEIVRSHKLLQIDPILSAYDGRLMAGFVFSSSPMRHKSSKWYVSLKDYPYSKYPPYVTAGAYILSFPALEDLYYTSMFTKIFKFDDIYLGIVAKKCGISPLHNEHFYFWKKPYYKNMYRNVIASHGFSNPVELKKVWEEQRSLGYA